MENEKTQSKKGSKVIKTILNTIINILIVIVLIVSILVAVMSLTSKANNGMSVIFGNTIENILTDSMKGGSKEYPSGDFAAGDVIIGKYTEYIYEYEYNVGDIVTYRTDLDGDGKMENVCHRIIEVGDYQGTRCYRTMGDNGTMADQPEGDYAQYLTAGDIGSVFYAKSFDGKAFEGKIIRGLGNVLTFLQTKFGFFICILLPMIIFFLYELIRVVFNAAYYKQAREKESKADAEAEKQAEINAAVADALEKRKAESTEHLVSSAPADMTAEDMEQFRQFQEFRKMQKAQQDAEGAKVESQADETPAESVPTEE